MVSDCRKEKASYKFYKYVIIVMCQDSCHFRNIYIRSSAVFNFPMHVGD